MRSADLEVRAPRFPCNALLCHFVLQEEEDEPMRRRSFMALSGACLVCGCSGAVHQLPEISRGNLSLAQAEEQGAGGPPQRRPATDGEMLKPLSAAWRRMSAPATQVSGETNIGVCQ